MFGNKQFSLRITYFKETVGQDSIKFSQERDFWVLQKVCVDFEIGHLYTIVNFDCPENHKKNFKDYFIITFCTTLKSLPKTKFGSYFTRKLAYFQLMSDFPYIWK